MQEPESKSPVEKVEKVEPVEVEVEPLNPEKKAEPIDTAKKDKTFEDKQARIKLIIPTLSKKMKKANPKGSIFKSRQVKVHKRKSTPVKQRSAE